MNDYGIYIAAAMLFLTIVGGIVKVMRYVAGVEKDLREHVADEIEKVDAEIENVARDVIKVGTDAVKRTETLQRETGEVGAALRTKIHEFEVFTRDHFVSTKDFEAVVGRLEKSFDGLGDRIEKRLDKLDERIEKMAD